MSGCYETLIKGIENCAFTCISGKVAIVLFSNYDDLSVNKKRRIVNNVIGNPLFVH